MLNIVIFGPPGAGKGTQSLKIAENYSLEHISTGNIFREEITKQSEIGIKVQKYLDAGLLVPDYKVVKILISKMRTFGNPKGFIFDGFPRTIKQATLLDRVLDRNNIPISFVLSIEVPQEELINRLLKRGEISGRSDDTIDVITNRLKVYEDQTSPLIKYYHEQGKILPVKGIGEIDDIFEAMRATIDKFISIKLR